MKQRQLTAETLRWIQQRPGPVPDPDEYASAETIVDADRPFCTYESAETIVNAQRPFYVLLEPSRPVITVVPAMGCPDDLDELMAPQGLWQRLLAWIRRA